jgi:hypothetical protein
MYVRTKTDAAAAVPTTPTIIANQMILLRDDTGKTDPNSTPTPETPGTLLSSP